jgi:PAS domain-containing protein
VVTCGDGLDRPAEPEKAQMEAMEKADRQALPTDSETVAAPAAGEGGAPAMSIAGLSFFMVDIQAKRVVWLEPRSLDFEHRSGLNDASLSTAMRHMAQNDQKQILSLIQHAVKNGSSGPVELGGDDLGAGLSLVAMRYQAEGGRTFVVAVSGSEVEDDANGTAVRGVAPLIRHLVEDSEKAVLVVDSFGYLRYANDALYKLFNIADPSLCIGRNIAHIPNRVGKTLTSVVLTTLARRAPMDGNKRFFLASGDSMTLNFDLIPFRVSAGLGGVVFSASKLKETGIDFQQIFNCVHAPMLVVDIKTRMLISANNAARKTFAVTEQLMESAPITETMLHPKTFLTLIEHARKGGNTPLQATVSGFDGVTRSKRMRATLIDTGTAHYLLIESKH